MIELLRKINLKDVSTNVNKDNLKAGIVYNEEGIAVDKVLFVEENGVAKNVFNSDKYSLNRENELYVSDTISMKKPCQLLRLTNLKITDLFLVYKCFINDDSYLKRHFDNFGMTKIEIGYKGKTEIGRNLYSSDKVGQEIYETLLKIINYQMINKDLNNENQRSK